MLHSFGFGEINFRRLEFMSSELRLDFGAIEVRSKVGPLKEAPTFNTYGWDIGLHR